MPPSNPAPCYLCGRAEADTRDHIPPRNLFLPPVPDNLFTVSCCRSCNEEFAKLDEQMRVFLTYSRKVSAYGKRVWKKKVVGSTFLRSRKLHQTVRDHIVTDPEEVTAGTREQDLLFFPQESAHRYFIRIVKGLLTAHRGHQDWSKLKFEVKHIDGNRQVREHVRQLDCIQKGAAFRCYYGVTDNGQTGLWILVFFDGEWFLVSHAPMTP